MSNTPRLLALDLDGTLIHADLVIAQAAKDAIAAVRARGVEVVLATGRMFVAALPFAEELALTGPLITCQGALVREVGSGAVLYHQPVPQSVARAFIDDIRQRGYHVHIYVGDEIYTEHDSPEAQFYSQLARKQMRIVGDIAAMLDDTLGQTTLKICAIATPEETEALVTEMGARYAGRLHVTRSYATFTEAVHPAVNKGAALAALAATRGLTPADVMAIGDNLNDLEMVAWAGTGVAVANAAAEVKAAAVYTTHGAVADGVVEALHKFILAD